jgi:hypothetical protein
MSYFTEREIKRLLTTGWSNCEPIARLVRNRGLPAITREYLQEEFSPAEWKRAEEAATALTQHFSSARFADEVQYGVLLVPDPESLDTRRPVAVDVRAAQVGAPAADVFDERLPAGVPLPGTRPWNLVVSAIGAYGPSLGSYNDITHAQDFVVRGKDTRQWMTRQLWGARVLQCGAVPPDCEHNERWTFTLFPGEQLVDGQAESGTVLKGRVRFRLGKPNRGIASARVAPALLI